MRDKSKPPCVKTGKHTYDEVTHYRKCTECGQFFPYRTEEDKKRRGEIGIMSDDHPLVRVDFDHDDGMNLLLG